MTVLARRWPFTLGLLAGVSLLSGCPTSQPPARLPQATSSRGTIMTLTIGPRRAVTGELIAVTDSSWYLLVNGRVGSVQSAAITSLSVVPPRGLIHVIDFQPGVGPDAKWIEDARQVARFPYGMSADILGALLARTSQSAPDALGTPP